jgi:hypothetical protein
MKRTPLKKPNPLKPAGVRINAAKVAAKREYDRFMALSDIERKRDAHAAAGSKSRPLTVAERAMFDEVGLGRRRGRPAKGQGARQISVTMERGLLVRVDEFAHQRGMSRAQFIARSLELAMAS